MFDKSTPAEREAAFVLAVAFVSARDKKFVSYAPDEEIHFADFWRVFSACRFEEKLNVAVFIFAEWSKNFRATLAECRADPAKLDSLHLDQLRELAGHEQEKAHQAIVTNFPNRADLLRASACLANFSTSTDAPTAKGLKDAKESIKLIWSMPLADETQAGKEFAERVGVKMKAASTKARQTTKGKTGRIAPCLSVATG
jgi:hypothetical protein